MMIGFYIPPRITDIISARILIAISDGVWVFMFKLIGALKRARFSAYNLPLAIFSQ
jgi:hypothetical protein